MYPTWSKDKTKFKGVRSKKKPARIGEHKVHNLKKEVQEKVMKKKSTWAFCSLLRFNPISLFLTHLFCLSTPSYLWAALVGVVLGFEMNTDTEPEPALGVGDVGMTRPFSPSYERDVLKSYQ